MFFKKKQKITKPAVIVGFSSHAICILDRSLSELEQMRKGWHRLEGVAWYLSDGAAFSPEEKLVNFDMAQTMRQEDVEVIS